MKRNKIKTLRNKADKRYQQVGMKKNKHCLICGGAAQCMHHFFTKGSSNALRYDEENGIPICQSCHVKIHMSQDPRMIVTIKEKRGERWYKRLVKKRQSIQKTGVHFYQAIIEDFDKQLKDIEIQEEYNGVDNFEV